MITWCYTTWHIIVQLQVVSICINLLVGPPLEGVGVLYYIIYHYIDGIGQKNRQNRQTERIKGS